MKSLNIGFLSVLTAAQDGWMCLAEKVKTQRLHYWSTGDDESRPLDNSLVITSQLIKIIIIDKATVGT